MDNFARVLSASAVGLLLVLSGCGPELIFRYDYAASNASGDCCADGSGNGGGVESYDGKDFPITLALTIAVQEQATNGAGVPLESLEATLDPASKCTAVDALECGAGVCLQTYRLPSHGACMVRLKGVAAGETIESCFTWGVSTSDGFQAMNELTATCE